MEVITSNDEKLTNTEIAPNTISGTERSHDWFAKRYLLAGILCLGFFCMSSLQRTTSLALIEMTKNRTMETNGTTIHISPEFDWNSNVRGLILSMHSYGHLPSLLLALLVKKFGGITTYGYSLLFAGSIYVLYPFIVRFNFYLFMVTKIVEGTLESNVFVSSFEIWSKWAPSHERSRLLSIQFTGVHIASAITYPLCGYVAHIWQWPSTFRLTGVIAIFVSSTIILLFSNEPSTDRHISEKERKYLMKEMSNSNRKKVTYPWKEIFTSKPLWALFITKFSYICGLTFLAVCLPHYIKDTTNMEINKIGILSGIPYILGIIGVPIYGWLADYMQNKNFLNATQVHKTYSFIGFILSACCFFILGSLRGTNFIINAIVLVVTKVLLSVGDLVIHFVPVYMAPDHSSLIASVTSYSFFLGAWLGPLLMGYVVTSHDIAEWSILLSTYGTILLSGGLIFIIFGSSEPQPWSRTPKEPVPEQNTKSLL